MKEYLRYFGFSAAVTLTALAGSAWGLGLEAAAVMLVLVLVEVTFSFENAVINAKVLCTMSPRWQTIFLTAGIFIAIFGMRVIFPVVIVMLTAGLSWRQVADLALYHPDIYAQKLEHAHPSIAAFGGAFLLMLCLSFFFDRDKDVHWIGAIERPLPRLARWWLPAAGTLLAVAVVSLLPANQHAGTTLRAGMLGVGVYLAVRGVEKVFALLKPKVADEQAPDSMDGSLDGKLPGKTVAGRDRGSAGKVAHLTGWAAFATFVYLEILDASFSFDGVIGAFAITKSVLLIAAGLGAGAVWVRSLTVYMVRKGTLERYLYLEHGAHYTVAVLAVALLLSVVLNIPEIVSGLAGVVFVGAAFQSSRRAALKSGTVREI